MEGLRAGEIARGQGADPRRHRVEDQLHRAPRTDFTAHRPLCRSRRPRERHRRQRLRLWNLGRPGRGRPGDRLGQARQPRRRRAPRLAAILAITQPLRARTQEVELMRFGLFGSAQARRSGPDTDTDSSQGFRDFIENNVEAEALGYYSTFLVEHHFTGFGQVSASLNLLTWLGARTRDLRLGTTRYCWPSRRRHSTCCRAAGSISASARATATTNLRGSAYPWRKPTRASRKCSRSSPGPSSQRSRSPIVAGFGSSTTSWSSRRP